MSPNRNREASGQLTKAAQYVRMSTEHQQYSTENQSDVIRHYAQAHGMEIVHTYADDGKSGLNVAGRNALRRLIADVENGTATFEAILVYDVSRWGRFQDADESAYYEYLCKRAHIAVHYCAEPFANDGSLSSTLLKTIKRTMAGEYSRELSVKVFAGQCRLIELGFRQGGPAGYGLRRLLIDQQGAPKTLLSHGERKSLQTDRVVLVPGPKEEIAVVREIYHRFTEDRQNERQISERLNARGIPNQFNRPWRWDSVREVLTNAKYIGANVYNRRSFKLKKKRVANPPEMWIRREDAFDPLIRREVFELAQRIIAERQHRYSNEEMLKLLRRLLNEKGMLSGVLIDETEWMPSSGTYRGRFKSLVRAYTLIGYTPSIDLSYIDVNRRIREQHHSQVQTIIGELKATSATVQVNETNGLLLINGEYTASLVFGRCRELPGGSLRWLLRLDASLSPDITIAARLQPGNQAILDYYLFPSIDSLANRLTLASQNGFLLDVYRFEDLSFFVSLARRKNIEEAT